MTAPREDGWEELRRPGGDLDWLMTLIVARASNAEYHRAKSILLKIGGHWPQGLDMFNAESRLAAARGEPPEDAVDFAALLHDNGFTWDDANAVNAILTHHELVVLRAATPSPTPPEGRVGGARKLYDEASFDVDGAPFPPSPTPPEGLRTALVLAHSMLHSGEQPTRQSEDIMHVALLASPAPDPGAGLGVKPPDPVVRSNSAFGDYIDFHVGGAIVIATNDGYGLVPCEYKLSHQLYVAHLRELFSAGSSRREVKVLPVNSYRGWIDVPRSLAAPSAEPPETTDAD